MIDNLNYVLKSRVTRLVSKQQAEGWVVAMVSNTRPSDIGLIALLGDESVKSSTYGNDNNSYIPHLPGPFMHIIHANQSNNFIIRNLYRLSEF